MDLEKVIKGLELCLGSIDTVCPKECPYYEACQKYENYAVFQPVMRDALEALKAAKPEKPIFKQVVNEYEKYTEYINRTFCAQCGAEFINRVNYCPFCGKAVKWEP